MIVSILYEKNLLYQIRKAVAIWLSDWGLRMNAHLTINMHVQLGKWSVVYFIHAWKMTGERLVVKGSILEMCLFNLTISSNKITVIAFNGRNAMANKNHKTSCSISK